jgi:hypothetical protein
VVEENKWPDHARLGGGQGAMHLEATEIDRARHDYLRNGVARTGVAGNGIFSWEETHGARLN